MRPARGLWLARRRTWAWVVSDHEAAWTWAPHEWDRDGAVTGSALFTAPATTLLAAHGPAVRRFCPIIVAAPAVSP